MRLFFAAMLPAPVQQSLAALRQKLDWLPGPASWSASENLHITLKFLGEVPDAQAAALASVLKFAPQAPLTLRPAHAVIFPPRGPLRVLGVGFEGDVERLIALQAQIEQYCADAGFGRESRPYVPHATLARFREGLRPHHGERLIASLGELHRISPFELTALQLMRSDLSPRGSCYTPIATYPLIK